MGFLLGGLNASIYIIGFIMEGLYGSMLSTTFSVVIQLSGFFLWKRRANKKQAPIRKMKPLFRAFVVAVILIMWAIASFILFKSGGSEVVIDGLTLVLGFTVPVLQMLGFVDVMPFRITSSLINLILWIRIVFVGGNTANLTYLISGIYGFYMIILEVIRWTALYKKQKQRDLENDEYH